MTKLQIHQCSYQQGQTGADVQYILYLFFLQPGAAPSVQRDGGTPGQGRQCSEPHEFVKLCLSLWRLSRSPRRGYLCNPVQHGSRDCMYALFSSKLGSFCGEEKSEAIECRRQHSSNENWSFLSCCPVNKAYSTTLYNHGYLIWEPYSSMLFFFFLTPDFLLLVFVLFCSKYFAATLILKLQSYLQGVTFGILRGKFIHCNPVTTRKHPTIHQRKLVN